MEEYVDHHLSLAEDANPVYLQDDVERFSRKRDPAGLVHSAWRHIELALNRDNDLSDECRKIYIDEFAQHLLAASIHATSDRIRGVDEIPYTDLVYYSALQLSSYAPLFTKRAIGQELVRDDVDNLYTSLGAVLAEQLKSDNPPNISEAVVYALGARTRNPDYVVYPASPREESCDYYPINHDGYFIQQTELERKYKKLPVQMKLGATALQYDSPVGVVIMSQLLKNAGCRQVEQAKDDPAYLSGFVSEVAQTIVQETRGETLGDIDLRMLHTATRSLVNHCRQAGRRRAEYDMAS